MQLLVNFRSLKFNGASLAIIIYIIYIRGFDHVRIIVSNLCVHYTTVVLLTFPFRRGSGEFKSSYPWAQLMAYSSYDIINRPDIRDSVRATAIEDIAGFRTSLTLEAALT